MRYRPNQAARALVTRRSNMVGLVVPDIENMFFSSLFKALEDVAIRDGYSVIVANSDDSRERERSLICGVSARGVDGLFLPCNPAHRKRRCAVTSRNAPAPWCLWIVWLTPGTAMVWAWITRRAADWPPKC